MTANLEVSADFNKPATAIFTYTISLRAWLEASVVIVVRRATMATLIEIMSSVSQAEAAQATIEAFCKDTGSLLIGRYFNEETNEVQLLVQLPHHPTRAGKHTAALSHALQKQVITSFRSITSDLVKISFDPPVDLREKMHTFPLRPGELWFPAIHEPHRAYIRMSRPLMLTKQAQWLLEHNVQWTFV